MCQWRATIADRLGQAAPAAKRRRSNRSRRPSRHVLLALAKKRANKEGCVIKPVPRDGRCLFSCVEVIEGWSRSTAPPKFEAWLLRNATILQNEESVRAFLDMTNEAGTMRFTRSTIFFPYEQRVQRFMSDLKTNPRSWWYRGSEFLLQVLVRWLEWDLTLVQAYENLSGLDYTWEDGRMNINSCQQANVLGQRKVWMLYYDEVDSIDGTQHAHYDVLHRRGQVQEGSADDAATAAIAMAEAGVPVLPVHQEVNKAVGVWKFVSPVSPQIYGFAGKQPSLPFDPLLRETDLCNGIQVRVPDGFIDAPASSVGTVTGEHPERTEDTVLVSIPLLSGQTSSKVIPLAHLLAAARRTWGDMHVSSNLKSFVSTAAIPAGDIDKLGHLHLFGSSGISKTHIVLHMTTGIFYDAISHGIVGLVVSDVSHYGCGKAECTADAWNLSEHRRQVSGGCRHDVLFISDDMDKETVHQLHQIAAARSKRVQNCKLVYHDRHFGCPPLRGIDPLSRTTTSLGALPPRGSRKVLLNSQLPWRSQDTGRLAPSSHSMHRDAFLALRNPTARDKSSKYGHGFFAANGKRFDSRVMLDSDQQPLAPLTSIASTAGGLKRLVNAVEVPAPLVASLREWMLAHLESILKHPFKSGKPQSGDKDCLRRRQQLSSSLPQHPPLWLVPNSPSIPPPHTHNHPFPPFHHPVHLPIPQLPIPRLSGY